MLGVLCRVSGWFFFGRGLFLEVKYAIILSYLSVSWVSMTSEGLKIVCKGGRG